MAAERRASFYLAAVLLLPGLVLAWLAISYVLVRRKVANNGREGARDSRRRRVPGFSCALMDVQMPEMGGFECTAIIRKREQMTGKRLPIIAMTAHAMKGDEARCLAAGMDGSVSKPIEPEQFFDIIERHLGISSVPERWTPRT